MAFGKWCCAGLESHFGMTGLRGFSVFVAHDDGYFSFIFQHRATEPGASIVDSDQPVSLVSDVQIQFCPWCGVRLADYYRTRMRHMDRSDLRVVY